ncbi:hypothetical protein ACOME3_001291 [Neoechinorhynchus agilis]
MMTTKNYRSRFHHDIFFTVVQLVIISLYTLAVLILPTICPPKIAFLNIKKCSINGYDGIVYLHAFIWPILACFHHYQSFVHKQYELQTGISISNDVKTHRRRPIIIKSFGNTFFLLIVKFFETFCEKRAKQCYEYAYFRPWYILQGATIIESTLITYHLIHLLSKLRHLDRHNPSILPEATVRRRYALLETNEQ